MAHSDCCISFYFESAAIRGHFCRVNESITRALACHKYPQKINELLAEMAAISPCFTADIKSNYQATMQFTGAHPVKIALVDSQNGSSFRCCATFAETATLSHNNYNSLSVPQLFGQDGNLVFTIDFENQRYQTIVTSQHPTLQTCFQHYFNQSEQTPSLVLVHSQTTNNHVEAAALILQKMPDKSGRLRHDEDNHWHDVKLLTATIKPTELLTSGPAMPKLIELVYHELSPIVSRETSIKFKCKCSEQQIREVLEKIETPAEKLENNLEVVCEYCGKKYLIDKFKKNF